MLIKDLEDRCFLRRWRSEQIAAIEAVDYVAINYARTATVPLKLLKPDVYCKGKDYKNQNDITGEIKNEIKILKKFSGKIYFTEEHTFSSSRLLNRSTDFYSTKQKKYLDKN